MLRRSFVTLSRCLREAEHAAEQTAELAPTGFFGSVRSIFGKLQRQLDLEKREERENASNPYIQYPVVTKEQMKSILNDKYKFQLGYALFAHHSTVSDPTVHSLSDLTDPTQLNSLLPRRRPQGSPADTLSIKAGDDAMLVSPTVMAIADGVSGWESQAPDLVRFSLPAVACAASSRQREISMTLRWCPDTDDRSMTMWGKRGSQICFSRSLADCVIDS